MTKRAVFLDRDGVLNELIFNPATQKYESPLTARDVVIFPWVAESLLQLQRDGFLLILVSNQPNFAIGKVTRAGLDEIHDVLHQYLKIHNIGFQEYLYCFHHPESIVPELAGPCQCRKPGTLQVESAIKKYSIDPSRSWFIGDQDTDMECAAKLDIQNILIENPLSAAKRGKSRPQWRAQDLREALKIILRQQLLHLKAKDLL